METIPKPDSKKIGKMELSVFQDEVHFAQINPEYRQCNQKIQLHDTSMIRQMAYWLLTYCEWREHEEGRTPEEVPYGELPHAIRITNVLFNGSTDSEKIARMMEICSGKEEFEA